MSEANAAPETAAEVPVLLHSRPPRRGELTLGWRAAMAGIWIGVIVALAAVWNTSVQLGLSTWWLGPRGEPQPRIVQFSPFIAPALMLLAAVNQIRWLGWIGLAAAGVVAGVGVGDIARVPGLAAVELLIAAAAAAASLASLSGTYRSADADNDHTADRATA